MWELELFRTSDGLRLGLLPEVDFSWTKTVRDSSMDAPPQGAGQQDLSSFRFSIAQMEDKGWFNRDTDWDWQDRFVSTLMPKKHGIMATWNGIPIAGGPIAGAVSFDQTGADVKVDGPSSFLANRYVIPEEFKDSKDAYRQITFKGLSLGAIAKRVVEVGMAKPSGQLPFDLSGTEFAQHERNYQAFNVANLGVADVLEKLSNVINGPDIDFRPCIRDEQHFGWRMLVGTERNPYLRQAKVHDWEIGSPDVENITADLSADFIAHRVYAVGDGEDAGTRMLRLDAEVPPEWPLIEKVVSDSQITEDHLLRAFGESYVEQFPVIQFRMTVRADGSTPLGTFWPGDLCNVTVHQFPAMADGTYQMRLLQMSGSRSKSVELVFDPVYLEKW